MSILITFSSVQFSHSVMSDSLPPHESQHARPPCPSPTPGVYPNSCASSQWCHPAISSSVVPFSSCPQSLPASGSFPMSQLFPWGGLLLLLLLLLLSPCNPKDCSPPGSSIHGIFPARVLEWGEPYSISCDKPKLRRIFSIRVKLEGDMEGAEQVCRIIAT